MHVEQYLRLQISTQRYSHANTNKHMVKFSIAPTVRQRIQRDGGRCKHNPFFFKLHSINNSTLLPNSITKNALQLQALRAPTIHLDWSSVEDACTVGELASSVYETLSSMPDVTCRSKSHSLPLHQCHQQTITANHQRVSVSVACNRLQAHCNQP